MNLARLIQAILSRVQEREGYVNKTKLVKYLYLFDIEHWRQTGHLLTGFRWKFHFYGPWTEEFESLYAELVQRGQIEARPGDRPDLDTEFVSSRYHVDLGELVPDVKIELALRHIVDEWADRRLGEMLDYVYFYTEPMLVADRGEFLDFRRVERYAAAPPEMRPIPPADRQAVERLRHAVAARKAGFPRPPAGQMTPPPYDDIYFEALRTMDNDEGY